MKFLPVVERELRVSARTPRLYWGRFTAALIAITLVAWLWFIFGGVGGSANRSKEIFVTLATFSFVYCLILGVLVTADSISEEKREGTLGLLFLTNLKGYDVVLGKLFANSIHSFYNLVAILPALAIPLLLGGLTPGDFWRMALVLLEALVLSLSVGMLVSSISKHDRKAQVGSFFLVVLITLLIPWAAAGLKEYFPSIYSPYLFCLSPSYTFFISFDQNYRGNESFYWISLVIGFGLSILALVAAAWIVRGVWQDRPKVGKAFRRQLKLEKLKLGTVRARKEYREKLLNVNAFYWLSARDRFKPLYVFGFLLVVAITWLRLFLYNGRDMVQQETFFLVAICLHTVMKIWVASESGRRFAEDRKSGALELTLSTPLTVREILEGQFFALVRQFGGAIGIILLFDLMALMIGARMQLSSTDSDWMLTCIAGMIVLVVDLFTIATLGMWLGLASKRASRAVGMTLFFIIVMPWLGLFGLITFLSFVRMPMLESKSFELMVGAYFILSVGVDSFFFVRASTRLTSKFREIATTRFDHRR